jgi:hypothetical protein
MNVTPLFPEAVRGTGVVFVEMNLAVNADEFPPDAVPLGIEHPPQLN